MFICKECNIELPRIVRKQPVKGLCSKCYFKLFYRTLEGRTQQLYKNHKLRAKHAGYVLDYTKKELQQFIQDQEDYIAIWDNWEKNNWSKETAPSIDREDSSKRYTLDNIQLVPWGFNNTKGRIEHGRKVKDCTTGKIYPSASEAARQLDIHTSAILKVCKGSYNTTDRRTFIFI